MHNDKKHLSIVRHYETCLEKYGDTHLGVDWPNKSDADTRYQVMLDVVKPGRSSPISLLDFGCGASHLYEYIQQHAPEAPIVYSGLDISEKFVHLSRQKFPNNTYYCLDLLDPSSEIPSFDYIVMNGVFTEKQGLSFDEMLTYFQTMLIRVFSYAQVGIAFNVMSKQVDWERDDLFHVPFDLLASFLRQNLSRHFVFRHDYRLYEYTTYLYR